jgi:hypothetical protein
MKTDYLHRIGYSFAGLLAGDAALFAYFCLFARAWEPNHLQVLEIFPFYVAFSFLGWIAVGMPAVLLIRSEFIARLYWLPMLLIGVVLGAFAQFLIFLLLGSRGNLNLPGHRNEVAWYFMMAVIVSTAAFAVYCALIRRALCKIESGAPSGTPQ